jgi:hypothetical protein
MPMWRNRVSSRNYGGPIEMGRGEGRSSLSWPPPGLEPSFCETIKGGIGLDGIGIIGINRELKRREGNWEGGFGWRSGIRVVVGGGWCRQRRQALAFLQFKVLFRGRLEACVNVCVRLCVL